MFLQHLHNGAKSWLGLNDIFTEGSFTWADRGPGNFTAWAKNQPNNFRDEDCVHALGVEYKYEWNDVQCSDCHQYTCKKGKMRCISLGMHQIEESSSRKNKWQHHEAYDIIRNLYFILPNDVNC